MCSKAHVVYCGHSHVLIALVATLVGMSKFPWACGDDIYGDVRGLVEGSVGWLEGVDGAVTGQG